MSEALELDGQDGQTTSGADTQASADTSSAAVTSTTTQADGQQSEQSAAAGDTTATKDEAPKSAFEAVKRLMDGDRKAAEGAATDAKAETADKGATGEQPAAQQKDGAAEAHVLSRDEWDKLNPKARNRIQHLSRVARTTNEQFTTYKTQTEPVVTAYNGLMGYVQDAGLSQDEFTNALEFARLVRQDPAKAYEMIRPVMTYLQGHIGEILPDDIQKQVDDGTLNEAAAKSLVRERKERERLEGQMRERAERDTQAESARRAQEATNTTQTAVVDWESKWKSTDPDYAKKWPQTWERAMFLASNEAARQRVNARALPGDVWVQLLDKARKDVEARLKDLMPARTGKQPIMEAGRTSNTVKAPTTALEAARAALAG